MRLILVALAAGLFATAAHADGDSIGSCGGDGSVTTCSFELIKSHDYVFAADFASTVRAGTAELINPVGAVTIILNYDPNNPHHDVGYGREFRAAYTGIFRIQVQATPIVPDAFMAGAFVTTDCRGDLKTQCALNIGTKGRGDADWRDDADWYRTTLRKGKTYNITFSAEYVSDNTAISIYDSLGRKSASTDKFVYGTTKLTYRAKTNGTYYISKEGYAVGYTISMK